MVSAQLCIVLTIISLSFSGADGALSWGTFLGADWRTGEGEKHEPGVELHSWDEIISSISTTT